VEVMRPRGVSLTKAPLYDPTKDFTCLDGSGPIPWSHVNDDYCDCRDGSDEPGTAACPNGVFHCSNAGHEALELRTSRVDDGICDCCDGTDEAHGCGNTCHEMGRAAREERARQQALVRQGHAVKLGLIEQGKNMRAERQNRLAGLELELAEAQKAKEAAEAVKTEAEAPEQAALQVYRDAEEAKRKEREAEEAKRAEERAAREQEEAAAVAEESAEEQEREEGPTPPPVDEEVAANIPEETPQRISFPGYKAEGEEEEGMEGEDDLDAEELGEETEEEAPREEEEPAEESQKYDAATQALVEAADAARKAFREAESRVRQLEKDVQEQKDSLDRNYGEQEEFRSLEGQCLDYHDHEYTYRLCPFDRATQTPKSGGGGTSLGTWGQWAEQGGATVMSYTNGQGCWNGPNRSTSVKLQCGTDTTILAVSEPAKCEYVMVLQTPAACPTPQEEHEHTEL